MKRFIPFTLILLALLAISGVALANDGQLEFKAVLSGAEEVPPVRTVASGEANFRTRGSQTHLNFNLRVRNGTGMLAAAGAHIHCAPAGQNGPVVAFLAGPVVGGFSGEFEVRATITDANIIPTNPDQNPNCPETINNLADLLQAMSNGNTYVNVHSAANPGGEIRGQIMED